MRVEPSAFVVRAGDERHRSGLGRRRGCGYGSDGRTCVDGLARRWLVERREDVHVERRLRVERALRRRDGLRQDVDVQAEPALHERPRHLLRLRRQDVPGERHLPR